MDSSSPVPLEPFLLSFSTSPDFFGENLVSLIFYLLLLAVLIFFSGVIASAETSFFSMTNAERKDLEKNADRRDGLTLKLLEQPKALLSTILIVNLLLYFFIVLTGLKLYHILAEMTGVEVHQFVKVFTVLAGLVILRMVFGEIAPKVYAVQNNLQVARKTGWLLRMLNLLLRPLVQLFLMSASLFERKFEKYNRGALAEELDQALDHVTNQTSYQGVEERNLLKGIVKFGNIYVTQIMRSRVDVVCIDLSLNFHELLDTVRDSGYSRIPVCNGDLDHTEGIIYAKDLLFYLNEEEDFDWKPLVKPALFIPESKKIDALLEEFQTRRVHMAIVVDEYGGASGLVTLEDVLEEVIGEIKDEFDDIHEIDFRKIDANNYLFEGKTGVNDVCKVLGYPIDIFEEIRGEADTIAGMLLEIKGELPEHGEEIEINGFTFKVMEINATRIVKVKITIHES